MFAPDFKETPYWWEGIDAFEGEPRSHDALPSKVDVVIVGGGLTGLSAACELARAGRDVVVLDSGKPGAGASSRNFGMLGRHSKHPFSEIMKTHGLDAAKDYYTALNDVYLSAVRRIEDENLDCDLRKTGRFVGALSPRHFKSLKTEYELRARHLGEDVQVISGTEQSEIGTQVYHGGVYIADNGSINPGRYVNAMLRRAEDAGARIFANRHVDAIIQERSGFSVMAADRQIETRDVVIATNGYSGKATPWISNRLAPIIAFMVATEKLPAETIAEILPNRRSYSDNRRTTNAMTISPDGTRLLMNGRTGEHLWSVRSRAREIRDDLVFFFPRLPDVKISHAWVCRCASTWNVYPITGVHDGIHYALGYCFSGNTMAPHLGYKTAMRILERPEAKTIWDRGSLPPKMPYVARQPWAMNILMKYYRWSDRPRPPDSVKRLRDNCTGGTIGPQQY